MRTPSCGLCGYEGASVRVSLVRWKHPENGEPFGYVARCVDRAACRERVEAQGEDWPVRDPKERVA